LSTVPPPQERSLFEKWTELLFNGNILGHSWLTLLLNSINNYLD
jgi:hypothetical protein